MTEVAPTNGNPALVGSQQGAMTQAFEDTMGKEEFLKLLMAQLEHQDPMNPMEDQAFVAQLATFSGLEQQMMTNQRLEQLQLSQLSASNAQLSGFIGKQVTAAGDSLTVGDIHTDPVSLQLDGAASNVTVTIRRPDGGVAKTVEYKNLAAGSHELDWSPVDENGVKLPPGTYGVEITATDNNGNNVQASALITGVVDKISFDRGYPELVIGGRRIIPANIISIETQGLGSSTTAPKPNASPTFNPATGTFF